MALGIYVDWNDAGINPVVAELVTAAKEVQAVSGEDIYLLLAADKVEQYKEALALEGVARVYAKEVKGLSFVQTDILSKALADLLNELALSAVFVPATKEARAVFARVAMKLNLGMTADCTQLQTELKEGRTVVHQIKPSFGAQVLVSCEVPQGTQIITLRPGTYAAVGKGSEPEWILGTYEAGASQIEVVGFEESQVANSITSAELIVAVGKGSLEGNGFALAKDLAAKIGATVAGTRPMVDNGYLPFEAQIGESGTVVRPKAILTLGVSGAVQFTEGIKGEPLVIAVNNDPDAAIFGFAKYAAVCDMEPLLQELLK